MADVTRLLGEIESGDEQSAEKLLPLVYEELRKLAAARLNNEKPARQRTHTFRVDSRKVVRSIAHSNALQRNMATKSDWVMIA